MQKKGIACMIFTLLIINIAAISFCITINENFQTADSQNTPKSASYSTLNYGYFDYDQIRASSVDNISWSFSSSNASVDIYVIAMNSANFSKFNTTQSGSYTTLSPGNSTNATGIFSPGYLDTWYIVYLNNDTSKQSTILSYNTTLVSTITNITITSPNGSSPWQVGSAHYINWTASASISNVNIYLFDNKSFYYTIALNVYNNGSYFWTIPSNLTSSNSYQIAIRDSSNSTNNYYSPVFYISPENTLLITTPTTSASWKVGQTCSIYWITNGAISHVSIYLYCVGIYYLTIATNITNNGVYRWTIPSSVESAYTFEIKIEDSSNPSIYNVSNDFYITGTGSNTTNQSNSNINTVSTMAGLWIFIIFLLGILFLAIFLGYRSRGTSGPYQPEMADESHQISQESRESINSQQISEFKQQSTRNKSNLMPDMSVLPNICPRCGVLVNAGSKVCPECGYRLVRDD